MPIATVDGSSLAYEVLGAGRPWVITPGGRFSKDSPGVRELAEKLVAAGNQVLIWDRPNCGESGVRFEGASESAMQADALAGPPWGDREWIERQDTREEGVIRAGRGSRPPCSTGHATCSTDGCTRPRRSHDHRS